METKGALTQSDPSMSTEIRRDFFQDHNYCRCAPMPCYQVSTFWL